MSKAGSSKELEESISIVPNKIESTATEDFDVCKEYGYKYESSTPPSSASKQHDAREDHHGEEEDDEPTEYDYTATTSSSPSSLINNNQGGGDEAFIRASYKGPYLFVLGKVYHPFFDNEKRKTDESSLFWFTYRCDFPELTPYQISTDAGWGCMLRSAQMMLGQALRMHFKSRDWKPSPSLGHRKQDPFVQNILTWFADFPSQNGCFYSLHNMCAAGFSKYQTLPGEWYGPGTACYVMRDLAIRHATIGNEFMFRVYVAPQGTVDRAEVAKLMTKDIAKREKVALECKHASAPAPLHPLDPNFKPPPSPIDLNWDTGLLLLIPLRLGLKYFNEEYVKVLAATFSFPQSVGVLGGRPRGARWFYGAVSDGSKVLGLDPHTVQNAPRNKVTSKDKKNMTIDLTDDYIRSVHTTSPEVFPIRKMDPSLALGFYCRNKQDFEQLQDMFKNLSRDFRGTPELFTFADSVPDYSNNYLNGDSLLDGGNLSFDGDDIDDNDETPASDEDEYVLL